jgi:hypothetical protein
MNRCWSAEFPLVENDMKALKDDLVTIIQQLSMEQAERRFRKSRTQKTEKTQREQERRRQGKRGGVKHLDEQHFMAETELPKNWRRCDGLMVEPNREPNSAPQETKSHATPG